MRTSGGGGAAWRNPGTCDSASPTAREDVRAVPPPPRLDARARRCGAEGEEDSDDERARPWRSAVASGRGLGGGGGEDDAAPALDGGGGEELPPWVASPPSGGSRVSSDAPSPVHAISRRDRRGRAGRGAISRAAGARPAKRGPTHGPHRRREMVEPPCGRVRAGSAARAGRYLSHPAERREIARCFGSGFKTCSLILVEYLINNAQFND